MNKSKLFSFLFTITLFSIILSFTSYAQSGKPFLENIQQANQLLTSRFIEHALIKGKDEVSPGSYRLEELQRSLTHVLEIKEKLQLLQGSPDTVFFGDTLVIGTTPGDELVIDSEWFHPGPIIVMGDGILRFSNAKATILGDLVTLQDAQVIVDSSYIYFPQEYFYQRNIFLTGNSSMQVHNSTLDFGGLVHTMATVDAASLELINVKKPDFSTVGMYGSSSITIDSIDMAGEFVVDENVNLNIKHAGTVLLWHTFREGANVDITFPEGSQINSYIFNNTLPGVSGVNYNISISSCKNVMWGMMPSNGSDVTVSNSDIRTIGMQFRGSDSVNVNGLVNNNHYDDFTAPVNDRYFHLNNCDVTTWSLYTFDSVYVDVKGCIIGEIGVMGRSEVRAFQTYIDGSGGYFFATDTTFSVIGFSSLTSSLRSSSNSLVIFAYSTMMNGLVQALQNSILMLVQSSLSADPAFDPGSVIWMANIASPASGFINSEVKIRGSSWIDKGAQSDLMDFDHYAMFYQKAADTTTWYPIGTQQTTEIRDGVLLTWDTHNIEAGAYFIKLDLTDNWGNTASALKTITLLPEVLGMGDELHAKSAPKVFPNPFSGAINIEVSGENNNNVVISIYDSRGETVVSKTIRSSSTGEMKISIDGGGFSPGIYYYSLEYDKKVFTGKLVKY